MTTVLAAGISAFTTLIVCLINNYFQGNKHREEYQRTMAIMEVKLENLTKSIDKLNSVEVRIYSLEKTTELLAEKISVANHRIEDLENNRS